MTSRSMGTQCYPKKMLHDHMTISHDEDDDREDDDDGFLVLGCAGHGAPRSWLQFRMKYPRC